MYRHLQEVQCTQPVWARVSDQRVKRRRVPRLPPLQGGCPVEHQTLRLITGAARRVAAQHIRGGFEAWCRFTHASLRSSFAHLSSQSTILISGMKERGELIAGLHKVKHQYEERFQEYVQSADATIRNQDAEIEGLHLALAQLEVAFKGRQTSLLAAEHLNTHESFIH